MAANCTDAAWLPNATLLLISSILPETVPNFDYCRRKSAVHDFCQAAPPGNFVLLSSVRHSDSNDNQNVKTHPTLHSLTSVSCPPSLPDFAPTLIFTSITLPIVAVETEQAAHWFILYDYYVTLANHYGVYIFGLILSVLSVRSQTIHVLGIQGDTLCFSVQAVVGFYHSLDDKLVIANAEHVKYSWQRSRARKWKRFQALPILIIIYASRRQRGRFSLSSSVT